MSVNKVILVGNLGRDPEVRYTANQTAVANLNLATNERRRNQGGDWADHTEWHRVVAFGKLAEFANNYLKKGRSIYVEGRLQTNKWQDKDGKDRYTTEIIADALKFVGNKDMNVNSQYDSSSSQSGSSALDSLTPAEMLSKSDSDDITFDDDDIPF